MAIVQNPIIGTAKKSAGGMVFSRSLDQNVIRAKPITYSDRKSDAQLMQRNKMKAAGGLTKADSKKALDVLYVKRPTKQTRFSRYMQQILLAITGILVAPFATFDWSKVPTLGNGSLRNVFDVFDITQTMTEIQVSWTLVAGVTSSESASQAFVVVLNTTTMEGISIPNFATVSSLGDSIPLPPGWEDSDNLAVYVGYYDPTKFDSSLAYRAVNQ